MGKSKITLDEAKELYTEHNWSLELCFKHLDDNTITLPQFSRLIIKEGLNEIHFDKLKDRKTTIEKTNYFKGDVMKVRGEDNAADEDSFFGDVDGFF